MANYQWSAPKPGSTGRPAASFNIKIMRDDGTECDIGEEGEIVIDENMLEKIKNGSLDDEIEMILIILFISQILFKFNENCNWNDINHWMNKKFVDSHSFSIKWNKNQINTSHLKSIIWIKNNSQKDILTKTYHLSHSESITLKKNVWQLRRIFQNKNCFIEEKFFDIKLEKSNVSTKILFMILWFYSRVFCLLIQLFILTILSSWFLSFSLNYSFLFFLFFNWGFCHFRLNFTIFIFHIFQFW